MCVCRQIASFAHAAQKGKQDFGVTRTRTYDPHDTPVQPRFNMCRSNVHWHWVGEDARVGPETDKAESDNPWNSHRGGSRQARRPPLLRPIMPGRCRVVGIDQKIDVGDDHQGHRSLDPPSCSHASSLSRRSSIPGRRLPGCARITKGGSASAGSPSPRLKTSFRTDLNGFRASRASSPIRSARSSSRVIVVLMQAS